MVLQSKIIPRGARISQVQVWRPFHSSSRHGLALWMTLSEFSVVDSNSRKKSRYVDWAGPDWWRYDQYTFCDIQIPNLPGDASMMSFNKDCVVCVSNTVIRVQLLPRKKLLDLTMLVYHHKSTERTIQFYLIQYSFHIALMCDLCCLWVCMIIPLSQSISENLHTEICHHFKSAWNKCRIHTSSSMFSVDFYSDCNSETLFACKLSDYPFCVMYCTCFVITLSGFTVSWNFKFQTVTAVSSIDVEYQAQLSSSLTLMPFCPLKESLSKYLIWTNTFLLWPTQESTRKTVPVIPKQIVQNDSLFQECSSSIQLVPWNLLFLSYLVSWTWTLLNIWQIYLQGALSLKNV